MVVTPTYPGVYIEEVPSPVRSIAGVSTSVTAFVGYTAKGRTNRPVKVVNFGDFERDFGGLAKNSDLSYAIQQYFLNGGREAIVVRVAPGAEAAALSLRSRAAAPVSVLTVAAKSEGAWGNLLRIVVDYATPDPDNTFNLTVQEFVRRGASVEPGAVERFADLSMLPTSPRYAPRIVTDESNLVDVTEHADAATVNAKGFSRSAKYPSAGGTGLLPTERKLLLSVDGEDPVELVLFAEGAAPPATRPALKTALESALGPVGLAGRLTVKLLVANGDEATAPPPPAPGDPAPADPRETAAYLLLESQRTDERSSVRVLPASQQDATARLKLGVAQRGVEIENVSHRRPAPSGTVGLDLGLLDLSTLTPAETMTLTFDEGPGGRSYSLPGVTLGMGAVADLEAVATRLRNSIHGLAAGLRLWMSAQVSLRERRLHIHLPDGHPAGRLTVTQPAGTTLAGKLGLVGAGVTSNHQSYAPGAAGPFVAGQLAGQDGAPPTSAAQLAGTRNGKKGMYALEDVDLFNILCIPEMRNLPDVAQHKALASEAAMYCAENRAMLLVDPPRSKDKPGEIVGWLPDAPRDKNAALYYPAVKIADPLDDYRLRVLGASSTVAGLYARTDGARGVWKAPAGTEATLVNVAGFEYVLSEMENGDLNPLGVNCLREFPVYGRVCWGARTLMGANQQASEWKYVPVRRLALFIEESLYRGTQWVVFEPNDEPLWSQIRMNVGAFLHDLFRKGAFQGRTPKEAYFVKCDRETTQPSDVDNGIVNILVGFAPLKPAEFVIIRISQINPQAQG